MEFELVEENKKLRENLKKMRKQLSKIKIEYEVHKSHIQRIIDFNSSLNPHLDLDEISELFFDFLYKVFSFEKGTLIIVNKALKYSYQIDFDDEKLKKVSNNNLNEIYEKLFIKTEKLKKTFLVSDIEISGKGELKTSCLVTPIWFENSIIGIVILENKIENIYLKNEIKLIDELIHNVGKVLYNAMLFSSITITSFKDEVTGVYNKSYFMEVLLNEMERIKRYKKSFVLIIADIDNFKEINNKYGYDYGNNLLKKISYNLQKFLRGCDTVSRYSGDKFIFLLPDTDLKTAEIMAKRINHRVQELELIPETITVSLGLIEYSSLENQEIIDLILQTEKALSVAKNTGKNKFISYRFREAKA